MNDRALWLADIETRDADEIGPADVSRLLTEIRDADAALAALGIPDDWRTVAERIGALAARHHILNVAESKAFWDLIEHPPAPTPAMLGLRANRSPAPAVMASPDGPVCGCGKPSRFECGWCGEECPWRHDTDTICDDA